MKLFKNKLKPAKYYRSIEELPIWNFNKVNETDDHRYLLRLDDYFELPSFKAPELQITWGKILEELLLKFGFDDKFTDGIREEKLILILKLKIVTGEKVLKTVLAIKEQQIADRKGAEQNVKQDFERKVALLSEHFSKVDFDLHKMTVLRFYTYVSIYSERAKKLNAK